MNLKSFALYLLLIGGFASFATSCIKEDYSDCSNLYRLEFSFIGWELLAAGILWVLIMLVMMPMILSDNLLIKDHLNILLY